MRSPLWIFLFGGLLITGQAIATEEAGPLPIQGSPEAGKELVMKGNPNKSRVIACQSCHGRRGRGNPQAGFPRLAGLSSEYMLRQLQDFATGKRSNHPAMADVAKGLSKQEMRDASAYYAQQGMPPSEQDTGQGELWQKGKRLTLHGAKDKALPACSGCHGPYGKGSPPRFPQLGGQHATYLEKQLADFAQGTRRNDPAGMMRTIANKLSLDERQAVAEYFSHPSGKP